MWQLNNFMKQGCIVGMLRGEDSTGLLQVNKSNDFRVIKSVVDGYNFSMRKNVIGALNSTDNCVATILHHRAMTHGAVAIDTCHPFEHEMTDGRHVVGVHNGTVNNFLRKEDGISFDVDSDWLYWRITRDGAAKALGEVANGSYALLWFEKPSNKFFIAANKERPIHWAKLRDKNAMVVASEAEMLYSLARRNGIELEDIKLPKTGYIYGFDPADLSKYTTEAIVEVPKAAERFRSSRSDWAGSRRPVGNVRDGQFTPVTPRVVEDNDTIRVQDWFGPLKLENSTLNHMEKVTFVKGSERPSRNKDGEIRPGQYDITGECINVNAKVCTAMILQVSSGVIENIEHSDEVECRVIGVRQIIAKKTGLDTQIILLAPPHALFMAEEKDEPATVREIITSLENDLTSLDDLEENWDFGGPTIEGPNRKLIPSGEWFRLVADGCVHCAAPITPSMASQIGWSMNKPLCEECTMHLAAGAN